MGVWVDGWVEDPWPPAPDSFNDLYRYSPATATWTALSQHGSLPTRITLGFAATPNGMLYLYGGCISGNEGRGGASSAGVGAAHGAERVVRRRSRGTCGGCGAGRWAGRHSPRSWPACFDCRGSGLARSCAAGASCWISAQICKAVVRAGGTGGCCRREAALGRIDDRARHHR